MTMGHQRKHPPNPSSPWSGLMPPGDGPSRAGPNDTDRPWQASDLVRRFRRMDWLLLVDAVPDARMHSVTLHDDLGALVHASSRVSGGYREIRAFVQQRVPLSLRVVWRQCGRYQLAQAAWVNDGLLGDHTVPVAPRLPEALLSDLRARPGTLRLMLRLAPEGVLFGWDVERFSRGVVRFDCPGGDFADERR
jgi:hypothetical protein